MKTQCGDLGFFFYMCKYLSEFGKMLFKLRLDYMILESFISIFVFYFKVVIQGKKSYEIGV